MDSLVAVAIATIAVSPFVYGSARAAERLIGRTRYRRLLMPRTGEAPGASEVPSAGAVPPHAVIVGYGPIGSAVAHLLADREIEPVVIELNIDTVRSLQAEGRRVVYGDAAQQEVLKQAGVGSAAALVLSVPEFDASAEIIRTARAMNPEIQVLARSAFLSRTGGLRSAGADQVFSGEAEVAMAMIDAILIRLGATPEAMDVERERARAELYRRNDQDGS
jgi:CPA2 family monovalent cation:H+ antiporter-2